MSSHWWRASRRSVTTSRNRPTSTRPAIAITANDQRQPSRTAITPPSATPTTEPYDPPAMNAPLSDARSRGAKTLSTTAMPTLP